MIVKDLTTTSIDSLVSVLLKAFENYFVPMPSDVKYWQSRFIAAGVDWRHSYGVFDKEELVAFIIHGVGNYNNKLTAYNTGTGVIDSHRGKSLVDKMYEVAIPSFRKAGISNCVLEVIQENKRAIKVYNRIGFEIIKNYQCYKGIVVGETDAIIDQIEKKEVPDNPFGQNQSFAWDNSNESVLRGRAIYDTYQVFNNQLETIGYFSINPVNGYFAQIHWKDDYFETVLNGMASIKEQLRTNNVDSINTPLIDQLEIAGFENTINQYEMQLNL